MNLRFHSGIHLAFCKCQHYSQLFSIQEKENEQVKV